MSERLWICCTGDELVEGRIADANGPFLARLSTREGHRVERILLVGDGIEPLVGVVEAARRAGVDRLLVCGGLGGTRDDLTREGLAAALGLELRSSPAAVEHMNAFWRRLGRNPRPEPWPESRLPAGCEPIDNPDGLALGFEVRDPASGMRIEAFPGVPAELRAMAPARLLGGGSPGRVLREREIRICGVAESLAAESLGDLLERGRNPLVGIAAKEGYLALALRATAPDAAAAEALLERDQRRVIEALGERVFSTCGETLAEVVVARLVAAGQRVAVAESLTGGLVADHLTDVPGVSEVLPVGVLAYANSAKRSLLGVPEAEIATHGAVSREVAEAMALGVRRLEGADWGLATTGIAGPTGERPGKPLGLAWVAVAGPGGRRLAESRVHPGTRRQVKERAALHALDLLRRALGGGAAGA